MSIRKDVLQLIKFLITEITAVEKLDRERGATEREALYQHKSVTLAKHIDDFMDMATIFGKGKLTKEALYHARSLLFTFISTVKEPMNEK